MTDLEDRLRGHLSTDADPGQALAAFDAHMKRTKLISWAFLALSVGMIVGGGFMLFESPDSREQLMGAVLAVLGGQVQLLIKLWYWQVHTRVAVQKDLRLLLQAPSG